MRDHRKAVNNANGTNMESKEIAKKSTMEIMVGFMQAETGRYKKTKQEVLQSLGYRKNWLYRMSAAREYADVRDARNQPPSEVYVKLLD